MSNEKNLIKFTSDQDREAASRNGKKGAAAAAQAKRDKRMLRDCLEILLEQKRSVEKDDGKLAKLTGAEILALTAFEKAMRGDIKAMEFVRDTAGQKPVDKVVVADVDPDVIDEVERMVLEDDDTP